MAETKSGGPSVLIEKNGAVTLVTLNRPERINAFNVEMHDRLAAALDDINGDEACRAVIITGAGRGFSAGQDLGDRTVAPGGVAIDLGQTIGDYYNPLVRRLRALSVPSVCAVNGVAAGAGASIALHCDIVLAARSARFIMAFSKIGLIPDSGGTWLLPRLLGEARARAVAMLAEPIGAEQAEAWGLIWKAHDDDLLMDEARALAARLAAEPTLAHVALRAALTAAAQNSLDQQLEHERETQQRLGFSPDYAEGVAAFTEKRAPRFTGRESS